MINNNKEITEILAKFVINEEDILRIRAAGELLKLEINDHIACFYDWMAKHEAYQVFFANNPKRMERVVDLQKSHWGTFFDAELNEAWFDSRKHVGAVHAYIDLPNDIYFAGMSVSGKSLVDRIRRSKDKFADADETADSIIKLVFLDSYIVIEEISRIQKEKIAASSTALLEMSTPVTPIWEDILLLPLLGIVDSTRTQEIMTKTLSEIAQTRAKVFVMDISGVSTMDTAVANQLIRITKATQLMGCETIISGVSPAIARTIVELGVNIGEVRTTATLRDSFELALKAVGAERQLAKRS
jgi:rsbT co-antagonist protein RsbR